MKLFKTLFFGVVHCFKPKKGKVSFKKTQKQTPPNEPQTSCREKKQMKKITGKALLTKIFLSLFPEIPVHLFPTS